jgi:hypothetical protein
MFISAVFDAAIAISPPPSPLLSFHPFHLFQSSYVRLADGWGVQLDVKVLHVQFYGW